MAASDHYRRLAAVLEKLPAASFGARPGSAWNYTRYPEIPPCPGAD